RGGRRRALAAAGDAHRRLLAAARAHQQRADRADHALPRAQQAAPARVERRRALLERLAELGHTYARRHREAAEAVERAATAVVVVEGTRAADERALNDP